MSSTRPLCNFRATLVKLPRDSRATSVRLLRDCHSKSRRSCHTIQKKNLRISLNLRRDRCEPQMHTSLQYFTRVAMHNCLRESRYRRHCHPTYVIAIGQRVEASKALRGEEKWPLPGMFVRTNSAHTAAVCLPSARLPFDAQKAHGSRTSYGSHVKVVTNSTHIYLVVCAVCVAAF